jgi:hypothetical protein
MTDDLRTPPPPPDDADAAPGGEGPAPGDPRANPFDAWLAEAPPAPASGLCPWCSARLDPPSVATCPSCGAHLHGGEAREIPGVTVVTPETAARRATPVKPSGSAGVLAWLSGDSDLVDAATSVPTPGPSGGPVDPAAGPGPLAPADPRSVLGPPSADAMAPPDLRVRREMWRLAAGLPDGALEPPPADDDAEPPAAEPPTAADDAEPPAAG